MEKKDAFKDYGSCLGAIETKGQNVKPAQNKNIVLRLNFNGLKFHCISKETRICRSDTEYCETVNFCVYLFKVIRRSSVLCRELMLTLQQLESKQ